MDLKASDITAIAISAAFWSILNAILAPIFWQLTRLPILCDFLASISLILATWWVRKPGTATLVGFLATVLNFILRPGAMHFLGFTVASVVLDVLLWILGYSRCFSRTYRSALVVAAGTVSTWVAGLIIGAFFMPGVSLLYFSTLHALGGFIGAVIAVLLVKAVEKRGIKPLRA
ncbi:MAG: hypothetical protein QW291_02465 [Thermofilaceae archaeon]